MNRRTFLALAASAVCCGALSGCTRQPAGIAEQSSAPRLVIGYGEYRPYIFVDDDGNYAGTDAVLATEACRRMGYEPVFKEIDWQRRDAYLESGQVDCLWSCFSMNDREGDYAWVGPYMNSREVVAVLEGSAINSLLDLEGKSIAVKLSTKPESLFLDGSDARIGKVDHVYCLATPEEIATALRNEYVDACAGHAAALRWCLQAAGVNYRFLDEDLFQAKIGVAFSKDGDAAVMRGLAEALDAMVADGTAAAIFQEYGLDAERVLQGVGDE